MARTKQTAPNKSEQEVGQQEYAKMTAVDLKKLLDARKIEGRSKLTKKDTMIRVLELFDQNPEDKASISALVAELSTPKKSKNASKSEITDDQSVEETQETKGNPNVNETQEEEKPKRKPRTKKETTESEEEKPKKTRTKKETTESEEEEKPKKTRTKKETTESEEKPKKTKTKKDKGVEKVSEPVSEEPLISDRSPSPSIVEMPEDPEATQKMSEEETSLVVSKKSGKSLPGAIRVLPDVPTKEPSKETSEEAKSEVESEPEPTAHQPEVVDLEDDPSMQEVFSLTRDILRRMKYLAREAHEDDTFKKSWINTLTKLRGDFDDQLGLLGVTVDE